MSDGDDVSKGCWTVIQTYAWTGHLMLPDTDTVWNSRDHEDGQQRITFASESLA